MLAKTFGTSMHSLIFMIKVSFYQKNVESKDPPIQLGTSRFVLLRIRKSIMRCLHRFLTSAGFFVLNFQILDAVGCWQRNGLAVALEGEGYLLMVGFI